MAGTYADLIQAVVNRELGIVGKEKTFEVAAEANIPLDPSGRLATASMTRNDLERLVITFGERFGTVAVVGCKITLMRLADGYGLDLPDSLK